MSKLTPVFVFSRISVGWCLFWLGRLELKEIRPNKLGICVIYVTTQLVAYADTYVPENFVHRISSMKISSLNTNEISIYTMTKEVNQLNYTTNLYDTLKRV